MTTTDVYNTFGVMQYEYIIRERKRERDACLVEEPLYQANDPIRNANRMRIKKKYIRKKEKKIVYTAAFTVILFSNTPHYGIRFLFSFFFIGTPVCSTHVFAKKNDAVT